MGGAVFWAGVLVRGGGVVVLRDGALRGGGRWGVGRWGVGRLGHRDRGDALQAGGRFVDEADDILAQLELPAGELTDFRTVATYLVERRA